MWTWLARHLAVGACLTSWSLEPLELDQWLNFGATLTRRRPQEKMRARSQLSCSKFPINLATFASWLPAAEGEWRSGGKGKEIGFRLQLQLCERVGEMFFISDATSTSTPTERKAKMSNELKNFKSALLGALPFPVGGCCAVVVPLHTPCSASLLLSVLWSEKFTRHVSSQLGRQPFITRLKSYVSPAHHLHRPPFRRPCHGIQLVSAAQLN